MKYPPIPVSLFQKNRKKLSAKLPEYSMAVIRSALQMPRNGDQYFPYRQNSDLFYLTGIEQEDTLLLLFPAHPQPEMREILFIRKPDKSTETWHGHKLSKEEAGRLSGIKTIFWLEEFDILKPEFLSLSKTIYTNNVLLPEIPKDFFTVSKNIEERIYIFEDLTPFLMECRTIKEPEEIDLLKKACRITENTFFELIKHVKPEVTEYEIESYISFYFLNNGALGYSFHPIVASGKNALALHYQSNALVCLDGDLLLLDFGCEYANYASDCSRTIPINGHFTKRQKDCYLSVLEVFEKAKELFIPGNCIANVNNEVNRLMQEQMIKLGLFSQEEVDNQFDDNPLFRQYYMHGVSHFIGLDAHDIGGAQIPFKPGMVVSCEPGIYIKEENIGIRIESMLLITDSKPIDLMPNLPSKPEEIERLMGK